MTDRSHPARNATGIIATQNSASQPLTPRITVELLQVRTNGDYPAVATPNPFRCQVRFYVGTVSGVARHRVPQIGSIPGIAENASRKMWVQVHAPVSTEGDAR